MKKRFISILIFLLSCSIAWTLSNRPSQAALFTDTLTTQNAAYQALYTIDLPDWKFSRPDTEGQQAPSFDDSAWQVVQPGYTWTGENTNVWFRATVTIPSVVNGENVADHPVIIELGVDDDGELYVNGQLRERFHWDDCSYTLTEHAHPGDVYNIAVRGMNGPGNGQLRSAKLYYNVLPELGQLITETTFAQNFLTSAPPSQTAAIQSALTASQALIKFTAITSANIEQDRQMIVASANELLPIAAFTKGMDVYYVGHAHIDMNWLWTWPDTIDTCHRTWNSAMNLMDEFPEFCFVQSQPGAYTPVQAQYPDEFARMQAMQKRGQWDLVGGLWNESDTDMPSGEALARSLYLGQTYFKTNFGAYAKTAWLPDSFGHSWQMPQLYQLAGMGSFYHMRCGDGNPFEWWEAPDGSKVLKANTDSYDTDVQISQLSQPLANERKYNLPESLVIFGVGDHGGGPTREQILTAKSFEQTPILPKVHLVTIDQFFKQLSSNPAAAYLPIIDRDLQYTFEGCYTTHADMKKAVRSSENNLYSAEVLSSLSAMIGNKYPSAAFDEAWKPTAFAQFHDIMCGSAIHSTYDWMHQQLAPAFKFETAQTIKALHTLVNAVDTQGPSKNAIVVWNTLSFVRDGVVRVQGVSADGWISVADSKGSRFPVQADNGDLIFVARQIPAFGYRVYFLSKAPCRSDGVRVQESADSFEMSNSNLDLSISKTTGSISKLTLKPSGWSAFQGADDANTFQLLGDSGDAWTFNYTGADHRLLGQQVNVAIKNAGPVCTTVAVTHVDDKSTYTQNITLYGALNRVDVPTTVDWQEHGQALKIRVPVNVRNPVASCQIPYGSIVRPTTGQECPGQKWMDVSDQVVNPVSSSSTIDLSSHLNSMCTSNYDGIGFTYPLELMPTAGIHYLGPQRIGFHLYTGEANKADNVVASGQTILLNSYPAGADTLFLLGSSVNGGQTRDLMLKYRDGTTESRSFSLNDWVIGTYADNIKALSFPYRTNGTRDRNDPPNLWIVAIPVSHGKLAALILPSDPQMHIFAASMAKSNGSTYSYGVSVLNDSKYGFDVTGNVFRLTALRSSNNPDPDPDSGIQNFTYSLYPHVGDWKSAATDEQALDLNIPLLAALTTSHKAVAPIPTLTIINTDHKGDVIAGALKGSEAGKGYILRIYETQGVNTHVCIVFNRTISAYETDILERPVHHIRLTVKANAVAMPIGHNQVVTLHIGV